MMQHIRSLKNQLLNSIARAIVTAIDDTGSIQTVKINVLAEETLEDVERVQNYGFASVPRAGAQAVVIMVGANRDTPIVIAAADPSVRKKIQAGEAAVYTDEGDYLYFMSGNKAELKTNTFTVTAPKFSVKNSSDDLTDLLVQLSDQLLQTVTALVPMTGIPAANKATIIASMTMLKTQLLAFKV